MSGRVSLIYGDEFGLYNFGRDHPLDRLGPFLAHDLARRILGENAPDIVTLPPPSATRDEVLLFHEAGYYDRVREACLTGDGYLDQGDTPAFRGGLEASLYIVGGSLLAARRVAAGDADHAFNLGGGLHHAHRNAASGFCIFNDIAVAIAWLLGEGGYRRVAYIDVDAHQGDGVMYGFYDDERVLAIDFHEDGDYLFPGTGSVHETGAGAATGLKANVPLSPRAGDADFVRAFDALVPPLIRSFAPEIILIQCGADGHRGDPLTHLAYSLGAYRHAIDTVHALAHEECGGRLLLFGGGGYSLANVATAWATVAVRAAERPVPPETPDEWRTLFENATGLPAPTSLEPRPPGEPSGSVLATLDDLQRRLRLL